MCYGKMSPQNDFHDLWRPLATCLKIFRHVANGRQGSPRFKGDPRDGWDELKPDRSYLSHFPPLYSKSGHFPIEIPIKNEKWPLNFSYGSIILKIVLWAHYHNTCRVTRVNRFFENNLFWNTLLDKTRFSQTLEWNPVYRWNEASEAYKSFEQVKTRGVG